MSPIGYIVPAIGAAIVGEDEPYAYLAARLAQALLGSIFLWLTFRAATDASPDDSALPLVVVWLASLHPQLVFSFAYVNNDARADVIAGCDGDDTATAEVASSAGISTTALESWLEPASPSNVVALRTGIDLDTAALLARLPDPGPATLDDPIRGLNTIALTVEPTGLEPAQ